MTEAAPALPPSLRRHRRQFVWQILLPVLLAALLGLAAAALALFEGLAGGAHTRLWADIALIWMVAPLLLLALVGMAVLAVLIWGLIRLLRILPVYSGRAQAFTARAAGGVRRIADGAARPLLWGQQAGAGLKSILSILFGTKR